VGAFIYVLLKVYIYANVMSCHYLMVWLFCACIESRMLVIKECFITVCKPFFFTLPYFIGSLPVIAEGIRS
jgi:hypothetical protein